MKRQAENANKFLVHKVRDSVVHLKLLHRQLEKISLDIERTINTYRDMIDSIIEDYERAIEDYENRLSNGQNSKDE